MPSPSINGAPIKNVPVFVDENLSWDTHVDKVSTTIAAGIGAIKRMKPLFYIQPFNSIFDSLIQPHFNYCNVGWWNCSKG